MVCDKVVPDSPDVACAMVKRKRCLIRKVAGLILMLATQGSVRWSEREWKALEERK
jgi:hypothetical protein